MLGTARLVVSCRHSWVGSFLRYEMKIDSLGTMWIEFSTYIMLGEGYPYTLSQRLKRHLLTCLRLAAFSAGMELGCQSRSSNRDILLFPWCYTLLTALVYWSDEVKVAQSCPTLCDPMVFSLPGSSAHGIFQARVLEWGAIAFSDNGIFSSVQFSYSKKCIWVSTNEVDEPRTHYKELSQK